jgi:hypothetical protein
MKMRAVFLCLPAVILLSGCAESLSTSHLPEMTFANFTPVELNVEKIEVRDDYKPPLKDPNVEHTFQTPTYVAAENLLKKQLVAAGRDDVLRAVITDASVVREALPMTRGFWGVFTHEPAERLKAKVVVRFELANQQAPDIVIGRVELTARRTKTLMEGTSVADRDSAYFKLTEDMMNDLDNGLMTVVKNAFGKRG